MYLLKNKQKHRKTLWLNYGRSFTETTKAVIVLCIHFNLSFNGRSFDLGIHQEYLRYETRIQEHDACGRLNTDRA